MPLHTFPVGPDDALLVRLSRRGLSLRQIPVITLGTDHTISRFQNHERQPDEEQHNCQNARVSLIA
jgi:hypothetical protein